MVIDSGIFWFRQDLRLNDNLALCEVIHKCNTVLPIYIFDDNIKLGGASKWWLHHSLNSLKKSLKELNSDLYFFKGIPKKILNQLADKHDIKNIYWNRLYDPYSVNRDSEIKTNLINKNINVQSFNASLINEPWEIKNKSNSFFKVFTPYWNTCLEEGKGIELKNKIEKIKALPLNIDNSLKLKDLKLYPKNSNWTKNLSTHWIPGEKQAKENLDIFKNTIIDNYDEGRDRPDRNYTSKLSPHLHFGEISPKRIFLDIQKKKK